MKSELGMARSAVFGLAFSQGFGLAFGDSFEVLRGGDRGATFGFEFAAGITGDGAARAGSSLVGEEALGITLLGDLAGGGFAEHGEDQL